LDTRFLRFVMESLLVNFMAGLDRNESGLRRTAAFLLVLNRLKNGVIRRVKYRHAFLMGKQSGCNVVVTKEIYIFRKKR